VPLDEDIQTYFEREVLAHIEDAWIDHSKTVKGYEMLIKLGNLINGYYFCE